MALWSRRRSRRGQGTPAGRFQGYGGTAFDAACRPFRVTAAIAAGFAHIRRPPGVTKVIRIRQIEAADRSSIRRVELGADRICGSGKTHYPH
jgi:hypothetical protein